MQIMQYGYENKVKFQSIVGRVGGSSLHAAKKETYLRNEKFY